MWARSRLPRPQKLVRRDGLFRTVVGELANRFQGSMVKTNEAQMKTPYMTTHRCIGDLPHLCISAFLYVEVKCWLTLVSRQSSARICLMVCTIHRPRVCSTAIYIGWSQETSYIFMRDPCRAQVFQEENVTCVENIDSY